MFKYKGRGLRRCNDCEEEMDSLKNKNCERCDEPFTKQQIIDGNRYCSRGCLFNKPKLSVKVLQ